MKKRLDVLLTEQGYFESREKAKLAIMEGKVFVNKAISDKPGTNVDVEALIEVKGDKCPFVSRGGFKLNKALDVFEIDVNGLTCLDIGASTGGFTDCMLQRGATKVYSVDVGHGQLDYKLRQDERVVCMEKYNFRNAVPEDFADSFDFACTDVSFISLKLIFPPAVTLLKDGAEFVALVKPQFEAGREQVGKKGIVKDPSVHKSVIENVIGYANDSGLSVIGLDFSPVTGTTGNIEFLIRLKKQTEVINSEIDVNAVVEAAHKKLEI
ncbi:MAG: TlyA family RNA methyltransferase [Clostridia bacterium]|nr:TlyA family RNA methyltransferase [Clostridia bacterium]